MKNSVDVSALSTMEKNISDYFMAQRTKRDTVDARVDMRMDSPVWQMHLHRAHKAINRGYSLNGALVVAEIMTKNETSLLDVLWKEGYRQSDYMRIEDGVKVARTDSSEIKKLELPRKDDVIMPYFVAYQNGVFMLGDTVNRHYVLTQDVQMVNAMMERGFVYLENVDVPLSDRREFFLNPLKDYKWRRHHKNAMTATQKHRSAVLKMALCSPSLPSEEATEYYLFKAERQKNRLKNKGRLHIHAMPQDLKDELKREAKILAGIVASLIIITSNASQVVNHYQKDAPAQPKQERKVLQPTIQKPNQRGGNQR